MTEKLKKGDELLFEKIFLAQFYETMRYIMRKYNAQHENAYDATMDALIEFRNRIITDKVSHGNLRFLFTRMAGQSYLRNIKKFQLSEVNEDLISEIDNANAEEDLRVLRLAWSKLGTNCSELLYAHIHNNQKLKDIAISLNKTQEAIRKRKERCFKTLIQLFKQTQGI